MGPMKVEFTGLKISNTIKIAKKHQNYIN